jgi:uncharacterized membrane protein
MARLSISRVWAAYLRSTEVLDVLHLTGIALIVLPLIVGVWYLAADMIGTLFP